MNPGRARTLRPIPAIPRENETYVSKIPDSPRRRRARLVILAPGLSKGDDDEASV
jgi:hypothetical protein